MASISIETVMSLRAQIQGTTVLIFIPSILTSHPDNFRYIHGLAEGDITIVIATHDNLYWAIVTAKNVNQRFRSARGHESEMAALQSMAECVSELAWQKTKENGITLSK